MKTVSSKSKKRKSNPALWVVLALMVLLCAGFTCAKLGVINVPGITPEAPDANLTKVAYLDAASAAGSDVKSVIRYKDINLDEETMIIPDDIITPADDVSGYVLRIDLMANTPLTWSEICPVDTDNELNDTARRVEVTYVTLSNDLQVGEYIDIRLKKSNTAMNFDYADDIVVSKKEVVAINGSTITLNLTEDELLLLTAAAVDMTVTNAEKSDEKPLATLYTTVYLSVGQNAAKVTYSNDEVVALLRSNPNLINNPTALYELMFPKADEASNETK